MAIDTQKTHAIVCRTVRGKEVEVGRYSTASLGRKADGRLTINGKLAPKGSFVKRCFNRLSENAKRVVKKEMAARAAEFLGIAPLNNPEKIKFWEATEADFASVGMVKYGDMFFGFGSNAIPSAITEFFGSTLIRKGSNAPEEITMRFPNFDSASGSRYWYTEDGVYRLSTHWGNVATCRWTLDGGAPEAYKNVLHIGFCPWNGFKPVKKTRPAAAE